MSAVFPIDSINSTSTSSLVLPPSGSAQTGADSASQSNSLVLPPSSSNSQAASSSSTATNSLVLPPSSTGVPEQPTNTSASDASLVLPASSSILGASSTTAPDATLSTPALSTAQPLNVVFNALASAGVDTAITQTLLAPQNSATTGTFSAFVGSLFDALAAQSIAQQAEQANATTTPVNDADGTNGTGNSAADQANVNSAANAFLANSNSTAPNSALESGVQSLAQTVASQTAVSTAVTANAEASTTAANSLSPLQQSFDEFLSNAGGTPTGAAGLGGFLNALATNLHTAPTPLGNIVNTQT